MKERISRAEIWILTLTLVLVCAVGSGVPPSPPGTEALRPPSAPTPVPSPVPRLVRQVIISPPRIPCGGLRWESVTKEYTSQPGEPSAQFTFWFTNECDTEVQIRSAASSCFCTVAKLPTQPWIIPPGSNGPIHVTMNLSGKSGTVSKGIAIDTTVGLTNLTATTHITPPTNTPATLATGTNLDRLRNMQATMADRQVVFKNADCISCHATPAKGKTDGGELYAAVCAVCHDSVHRASMVPELRSSPILRDETYWKTWIAHGRVGSMMPAFAQSEGGPLDEIQIANLARHLTQTFTNLTAAAAIPAASGSR